MKKICFAILLIFLFGLTNAQVRPSTSAGTETKKEQRRKKINAMIKQAEEGVLIYNKQTTYGLLARSNGYGIFYEMGRMKTPLKSTIYRVDFTEIKHPKEDKFQNISNPISFLGNPYVFGKVNNFYQLTFAFGQQHILGQKGNKNGVSVSAIYNGGLSLGLLKPYYLQVEDPVSAQLKYIKYSTADSAVFLGPTIVGSGGFWRGWKEVKLEPGLFVKTALRFDYGRFNEVVSALELGLSAEYYTKKITIMALQEDKPFFFQGYISLLFGRRK